MYWNRTLEETIRRAEKTFPVIVITGPRQSGKSTLLRNYIPWDTVTWLTLDDPQTRDLLSRSPQDYLESLEKPVVIDEFQYLPELLTTIKLLVDRDRSAGSWYLTGSQKFTVMKHVSESLAGRAALLALPTFHTREFLHDPGLPDRFLRGSFPEPVVNPEVDISLWYGSYFQSYLERDLRSIINIGDMKAFEHFFRLLAARTGQELNQSALASEAGVSVPTIKRWISVLEASYIIHLVYPYYKNFGKRLAKAPRVYFMDTGIVCYQTGIRDADHALRGPMAGQLFETLVATDIIKKMYANGLKPEIYFWRSHGGLEVDLLIPFEDTVNPIEIKLTSSIRSGHYRNLQQWMKTTGQNNQAWLITADSKEPPLPGAIKALHYSRASEII